MGNEVCLDVVDRVNHRSNNFELFHEGYLRHEDIVNRWLERTEHFLATERQKFSECQKVGADPIIHRFDSY